MTYQKILLETHDEETTEQEIVEFVLNNFESKFNDSPVIDNAVLTISEGDKHILSVFINCNDELWGLYDYSQSGKTLRNILNKFPYEIVRQGKIADLLEKNEGATKQEIIEFLRDAYEIEIRPRNECQGIKVTCENCGGTDVFIDAETDIMFCENCGEHEQAYYKSSEDTDLKDYE